jgi:hypothetical protein
MVRREVPVGALVHIDGDRGPVPARVVALPFPGGRDGVA